MQLPQFPPSGAQACRRHWGQPQHCHRPGGLCCVHLRENLGDPVPLPQGRLGDPDQLCPATSTRPTAIQGSPGASARPSRLFPPTLSPSLPFWPGPPAYPVFLPHGPSPTPTPQPPCCCVPVPESPLHARPCAEHFHHILCHWQPWGGAMSTPFYRWRNRGKKGK